MKKFRNKLMKENLLGTFVSIASLENVEIMSNEGFDFFVFDLEHSMIGLKDLLAMIAVTEKTGASSLVRVPQIDPGLCKRVLDAGCQGIMFPMIADAEQARNAVKAVKYPPKGIRGLGLGRAQGYGANYEKYAQKANSQTCVILQIETVDGLNNLEEIISVPDIDVIFIGTADLKKNLGPTRAGAMERHIQKIAKCCQQRNITVGTIEFDALSVKKRYKEGFRFITYGVDCLIYMNAVKQIVSDVKTKI
jgi:2-keto-3-deoxy-L-rhamnonate aldolase RhmA